MAIGKFSVTIEDTEIKRVSQLQVYKFTRNETRTTSFAGTDRVDRSAVKYRVTMTIALCTASEMQVIERFAEGITHTVTFPHGGGFETKTMIIDLPQTPQPIYKYGKQQNGVYYQNLRVNMEEV